VIGSGGGGVVYEAVHPELKKRVAVKTLHRKLAENQEALRRFLREGEAASRIRHPNVVDITDVGVHEGQPYLVMELLEGRDLRAYLAARGPLPLSEAVDLMLPVIAAVGAGHDAGVVHRDLKPHNVFIASGRGVSAHPKVLDFGVSKLTDPNPGAVSWSGVENMVGTLCYMAPEQVRGERHLDGRVDQYALGLILYECLTGNRVHAGDDQVEIIRNISEGAIRPPRQERPDLPARFEAVLMQALATRPSDRFPSVYDFGRALLPFAGERAGLVWKTVFENQPSTQRRAALRPTELLEDRVDHDERRPRTATLQSGTSGVRPGGRRRLRLLVLMLAATLPLALGAALAALVTHSRRSRTETTEVTPPARGAAVEPLGPGGSPPSPASPSSETPSAPSAAAPSEPATPSTEPRPAPRTAPSPGRLPAELSPPTPTIAQPTSPPPSASPAPAAERTPPTPPAHEPAAAPARAATREPAESPPAATPPGVGEFPPPASEPTAKKPASKRKHYEMGANQAPIITD
jgi:serine/threonine-protein kinase